VAIPIVAVLKDSLDSFIEYKEVKKLEMTAELEEEYYEGDGWL